MPFPVSGRRGMRPATMLPISPQSTDCDKIPASVGGINAVSNISMMPPDDAVSLYNLIPAQYGLRVRTGYQEWCTNVGSGGVRTIIPFLGSIAVEDRLFGCAQNAIYEISASSASPTSLITFGTQDATSGYGVWTNCTTNAGHFSLYTDESNGYYIWNETTDAWTKVAQGSAAGQIDGVDPAEFVCVTTYAGRVWFGRKNSARVYYLPAGLITGKVTEFNFGNKFKFGGSLVGLYTWTLGGGESTGINSYLIAVSSSGDILVYQGNDPDVPGSFVIKGNWFVGPPPAGRRVGGAFGGEFYILSSYGLLPLSKLLSGVDVQINDIYLTRKITPLVNTEMRATRNSLGWEVRLVPTENLLLVSIPTQTGVDNRQFVQSINSQGWAFYRDIPYYTGDTWHGNFYIGTSDGRILLHTGNLDNVLLSDPNSSSQIEWSGIMSFKDYGELGAYNLAHFIRPVFMAQQAPSYAVEARFDYDITEVLTVPAASAASGALWDVAIWDVALWGGNFQIIDDNKGASGMGRAIAVAVNGRSGADTTLIRFDLMKEGAQLNPG